MGIHRQTIELRESILAQFQRVEPPVTVRQMFYMVSSSGAVEKEDTGYNKVQRQVLEMRREGVIPYGHIADNTRYIIKPRTWESLSDCLESTAQFYRSAVWKDTDVRVEVWCEKDALRGVLAPVTRTYDVPLMVCRGYSSETFAYEAAETIADHFKRDGKRTQIYYIGDMDPSGWDMSRNLQDKIFRFVDDLVSPWNKAVNDVMSEMMGFSVFDGFSPEVRKAIRFKRLSITESEYIDAIERGTLQSRPTKKKDTRTKRFFEEFGQGAPSIEVEAVHPDVLRATVMEAIESHLPAGALEAVKLEEAEAKNTLNAVIAGLEGHA